MGILPEKGDARFNFMVGIVNGVIFTFGTAFMDPTTVLPVFIKHYTTSDTLVGLASSLHRAGWHLPQLFIAGLLERRALKLGVYLKANAVRMALLWLFVLLLGLFGNSYPHWVLSGFIALFGIASLAGGVAGLPFTDIVGKVIPRRHTGVFYAIRFFFGAGVLSIAAGIIVRYLLGVSAPFGFPTNYVIIFALATGLMTIGVAVTSLIREPEGAVSATRRTAMGIIREIPHLLRTDVNFRRLLIVQILASGIGFSLPFYVVYAREQFGVAESSVGLFLAIQTIGFGLSNVVWGRASARRGNRSVITGTAISLVFIPLLALGLSWTPLLKHHLTWIFFPIFFLIGTSSAGTFIGFKSYLLDIAPDARRPTYVGITNTVMGGAALFPALGGVMADFVHFNGVFAVAGAMVLASAVMSLRLKRIEN